MANKLPTKVAESLLFCKVRDSGLQCINQGKVRDTFLLPSDHLLVITSDRLSVYDFVLSILVQLKGDVLNMLSTLNMVQILSGVMENHLIAYGTAIDEYLPVVLHNDHELQAKAVVVKKYVMFDGEIIVRAYITGSMWKEYKNQRPSRGYRTVWGHRIPDGLHDGSKFPMPIVTPSTKSKSDHDEPIPLEVFLKQNPKNGQEIVRLALLLFDSMSVFYAKKGLIVADTKYEFGLEDGKGTKNIVLCDEAGTPDSSRFWDENAHARAALEHKAPSGYDKEPARQRLSKMSTPFLNNERQPIVGLNNLKPSNRDHVQWVSEVFKVPVEVGPDMTDRYQALTKRVTGKTVEDFKKELMNIGN